ncbi:MAG: right-handed parallel beta-helix repeat-containing protein [Verrucomicrobia bacterium]|nr:right-handed parallel beta-helix repeat-containing protein [Verrucomicrobiota bacterium]
MKCFFVGWLVAAPRCPAQGGQFNLASFSPRADGATDDTPALTRCFESVAKAGGGTVVIPPGDYFVSGGTPVSLSSRTTVSAYGARFHLPEKLGDQARVVVFSGQDVRDFNWFGGHFTGRCFDPKRDDNTWEPNVNTRMILITTSAGGRTENLTFRDISSERIAGAVVSVHGAAKAKSESEVETFARHVTVDNCTLLESGKFMWDYGYLWQITVWPEDHTPQERAMAAKYFRNDLVIGPVKMAVGDDRMFFDNAKLLPVSQVREGRDAERGRDSICFFGDTLPSNLVRGKQYFVVESTKEFIRIAEKPLGKPIRFKTAAGPQARLMHKLFAVHPALYAPKGSGPGKGGVDITCAQGVRITGCKLSALGDTMHVQRCHNVVFANNHILGSRMGAFFIAEFCKNVTVTGNTVDGTNGSRVMSVEKSAEDVTIIGNTFRNGGRGSWINQPRNLVLQGNVFINNTTKCERDPRRGRRSFVTGDYESYAELYFTTHEPNGRYGNVIVRDNIFVTGPEASHAIRFQPGGDTLLVTGNIFRGGRRTVEVESGCTNVIVRDNVGIEKPAVKKK